MSEKVRYERIGRRGGADDRPARAPQRGRPRDRARSCAAATTSSRPTTAPACSSSPAPAGTPSAPASTSSPTASTSTTRPVPMGFTRLTPSKPTIAAIEGWCVAGGLELALWCDLRVATAGSTFGCFERRWGVPLIDGGTQRLPRVVGLGRALDLILTGRPVDAEEAQADRPRRPRSSRPAPHLERALRAGRALAAFPQETMLADRRAAIEGVGMPLADGLALEHRLGRETLAVGARGAARFAAGEGRHGRERPAESLGRQVGPPASARRAHRRRGFGAEVGHRHREDELGEDRAAARRPRPARISSTIIAARRRPRSARSRAAARPPPGVLAAVLDKGEKAVQSPAGSGSGRPRPPAAISTIAIRAISGLGREQLHQRPQRRPSIRSAHGAPAAASKAPAKAGDEDVDDGVVGLEEADVLAGEHRVELLAGDLGPLDHVADRRRLVALGGDDPDHRLEHPLALRRRAR